MDRLDALRRLIEQNPSDRFARYALAQEYMKADRPEEAVAEFHAILSAEPDYKAVYYHCGQALEKLGRLEEARAMYERGIEVTSRLGDEKTRSEIQVALDLLG